MMMKAKYIKTIMICFAAISMLGVVITALFLPTLNKKIDNEKVITLRQFYNLDGKIIILPDNIDIPANQSLNLKSILPNDVKDNDYICIWTNHQNLIVFADGIEIHNYQMNERSFFGRLDGSFWHFVPLASHMSGEELMLNFSSRLSFGGGQIQEVNLGSKSAIILNIVKNNILSFVLSSIILFLGVFIIFLYFLFRHNLQYNTSLLYLGTFTAIIGLWLLCEAQLLQIFVENFYFVTILSCMCVLLMPVLFFKYFSKIVYHKVNLFDIASYMFVAASILIIILQLISIAEMAETLLYYDILIAFFLFICFIVKLRKYLREKTKPMLILLIADCSLLICAFIEVMVFAGTVKHIFLGSFLRLGILFYVLTHGIVYMYDIINKAQEAQNLKHELFQNRMLIAVSQMKPHFLFNALNAIGGLCLTNPQEAEQAISDFANYLRANIKMFDTPNNIQFTDEIKHIKNYVAIEQMRFGDKINVEYDIQFTDFQIPPLSVQPLIENAIKHGIGKKTESGTVTLRAYKECGNIIIKIEDDGIGFNVDEMSKNENSIGLKYVQKRLDNLGNAAFHIESTVGVGSKISITIPEGENG